jgi:hypothetical protein
LYYFIATEVGIANYIQRVSARCTASGQRLIRQHFDWAENNLFVDEISGAKDSSRMAVFLGAQDIIIDAPRARRYLERRGWSCRVCYFCTDHIDGVKGGLHWNEKGGHGDGLSGDSLDRVIKFVSTGSVSG